MLVKQAVEVAAAAVEFLRQFAHGQVDDFGGGKSFKHLEQVFVGATETAAAPLHIFELRGQDGGADPDQLAAVIQVELRGDQAKKPVGFDGQRGAGRINSGRLIAFRDVVQQADFLPRKKRQQVFEADGKVPEQEIGFLVLHGQFAAGDTIQDENVTWRNGV